MKKRTRFPLMGLALLALAGGLELIVVDGTLTGKTPINPVLSRIGMVLEQKTAPSTASAQPMYIWKDASGVTHISETPPPSASSGAPQAREYQFSPQPPAEQPAPVETPVMPEYQAQAPSDTDAAIAAVGRENLQEIERLKKELELYQKQFIRARNMGDGYAQTRFRTLIEQNREALARLAPETQQ